MVKIPVQGHIIVNMPRDKAEQHAQSIIDTINGTNTTELYLDLVIATSRGCKIQMSGERTEKDNFLSDAVYKRFGLKLTDIGTPENINNLKAFDALD